MISLKTLVGIALSFTLVATLGCSRQEEASAEQAAPEISAAAQVVETPTVETAESRPTPEERAKRAKDQMEQSAEAVFTTAQLIDPNTATAEQLAMIPGLSPEGAEAVLSGRPFASATELHAAISDGMSEENLRSVYSAMFVKVNLNSSANEDFRLVPSTLSPRKLAHEFEEYRPYSSIEDFQREMSKYVSDAEVAFLERYVIVD